MHSDVLRGAAFIVPDYLSEVTDPDRAVHDDVQELSYWAQGDAFGYSITDRSGDLIGSCGGYFGWSDSRNRFYTRTLRTKSGSTRVHSSSRLT
jgi:hypothetical protein